MVDTVGSGMPFVATGNSGSDSGFGGGGLWAIVLIALFACGGGGFGGGRGGADNAEINGRFNSLENQISSIDEKAAIRENYKESCDTNMNVTMQGGMVKEAVIEAKFENAIIAKDAQLAAAECCCTTNRNIDAVRFENEKNTGAIIASQMAGTQRIVDMITADKIETLRDKLADERLKVSQIEQNAYLVGKLGAQTPVPAYVTYPAGTPIFPPTPAVNAGSLYGAYAGNGCGCGNSAFGYC